MALDSGQVEYIPIDRIEMNPFQPRHGIDEDNLQLLANSIREHGLLQPVVVRRLDRGYQLIAGERRFRAARLAGLDVLPALIRRADSQDSAVLALIENLHRQSLSYWDEAEGFLRLHTEFHLTQAEIARQMGMSQGAVANKLRLLQLEADVTRKIQQHGLSERHARLLLSVPSSEGRRALVDAMIEHKLTVRQAEEWMRQEDVSSPAKRVRRAKAAVKDFRIVYNAFERSVQAVQEAGMKVEMTHSEQDDCWEIRVRIAKR